MPPATSSSSEHTFSANSLDLLGIDSPPADSLSPYQTTYTYNADRQLTNVAIPFSSGTTENLEYNHDSYGRLASILDQESGDTRQFTYVTSPAIANQLPTSGHSVHYAVDGLNRRISRELDWGTPFTQQFVYDDHPRVAAELTSGRSSAHPFIGGAAVGRALTQPC